MEYKVEVLEKAVKTYVDKLTGVQYLRTYKGGVCVMVDAEGKPLIWEGEK